MASNPYSWVDRWSPEAHWFYTPYPGPEVTSQGTVFRVWSPEAERMHLVLPTADDPAFPADPRRSGTRRVEMTRSRWHAGEWEVLVPRTGPGQLYLFQRDQQDRLLPDPMTRMQPYGVHGPSQVIDPTPYPWPSRRQAQPRKPSVIYELEVGTFTPEGTFDAAIGHLDRLKSMGIDTIEIMPPAGKPGFGWGYEQVNLLAIYPGFSAVGNGTRSVQRFNAEAEQRGIQVIADVVFNHLGPEGNYVGEFGPYFSTRYPDTPWGVPLNFDEGPNAQGARGLVEAAVRLYLSRQGYGFHGLRLDAAHAYTFGPRSELDPVEHPARMIRRVSYEVGTERRHQPYLIAEHEHPDRWWVDPNGAGMDAVYADFPHHVLDSATGRGDAHTYTREFHPIDLPDALSHRGWRYSMDDIDPAKQQMNFNNHDQQGNTPTGARPYLNDPVGRRLALLVSMVQRGPVLVFQGDLEGEKTPYPFSTKLNLPEGSQSIRFYRAREFKMPEEHMPDPQVVETYVSARNDWSQFVNDPSDAIWATQLIGMRTHLRRWAEDNSLKIEANWVNHQGLLEISAGPIRIVANFTQDGHENPYPHLSDGEKQITEVRRDSSYSGRALRPGEAVVIQNMNVERVSMWPEPRELSAIAPPPADVAWWLEPGTVERSPSLEPPSGLSLA